jgi:hypothetical protein
MSTTHKGYNTDLFSDPVDPEYICPICLMVCKEPSSLSCCGQLFCSGCLTECLEKQPVCPVCRQSNGGTTELQHYADRKIGALKYRCPEGCDKTDLTIGIHGEVLRRHLQDECTKRMVHCEHRCGMSYRLCDREDHENNHCRATCPNACDVDSSYLRKSFSDWRSKLTTGMLVDVYTASRDWRVGRIRKLDKQYLVEYMSRVPNSNILIREFDWFNWGHVEVLNRYTTFMCDVPSEPKGMVRPLFGRMELVHHLNNECPLTKGMCSDCRIELMRCEEPAHMSSAEHKLSVLNKRVKLLAESHPDIQLPIVQSEVLYMMRTSVPS